MLGICIRQNSEATGASGRRTGDNSTRSLVATARTRDCRFSLGARQRVHVSSFLTYDPPNAIQCYYCKTLSLERPAASRTGTIDQLGLRGERGHRIDDVDSNCHCFAYRHSKSCFVLIYGKRMPFCPQCNTVRSCTLSHACSQPSLVHNARLYDDVLEFRHLSRMKGAFVVSYPS